MILDKFRPFARFFARIRALDIGCPSCSRVSIVRAPWERKRARESKSWNMRTAVFKCPYCGIELVLGVIAWRRPAHWITPIDARPTRDETFQLTQLLEAGVMSPHEKLSRGAEINRTVPYDCTCKKTDRGIFRDMDCPVHGWEPISDRGGLIK